MMDACCDVQAFFIFHSPSADALAIDHDAMPINTKHNVHHRPVRFVTSKLFEMVLTELARSNIWAESLFGVWNYCERNKCTIACIRV